METPMFENEDYTYDNLLQQFTFLYDTFGFQHLKNKTHAEILLACERYSNALLSHLSLGGMKADAETMLDFENSLQDLCYNHDDNILLLLMNYATIVIGKCQSQSEYDMINTK